MKDTDFIIKQGWMVTKLHLAGPSLELYALIYGYTKDGVSWYETNVANIMEWLAVSERTVQRHLKMLVEARYILRRATGEGRKARLLLQANTEILDYIEKGAEMTPLKRVTKVTKKGDNLTPLTPEKGDKSDKTPYIRIKILKDNKSILLRADARAKEEEEFFEIFFFKGAADPAAEVHDFICWNEAKRDDWQDLKPKERYYYASSWSLNHGERRHAPQTWLSVWAEICNWVREKDPESLAMMLDTRFGCRFFTDPMENNKKVCELTVTKEVQKYLKERYDDLVKPFLNPYAHKYGAHVARWNFV